MRSTRVRILVEEGGASKVRERVRILLCVIAINWKKILNWRESSFETSFTGSLKTAAEISTKVISLDAFFSPDVS